MNEATYFSKVEARIEEMGVKVNAPHGLPQEVQIIILSHFRRKAWVQTAVNALIDKGYYIFPRQQEQREGGPPRRDHPPR